VMARSRHWSRRVRCVPEPRRVLCCQGPTSRAPVALHPSAPAASPPSLSAIAPAPPTQPP
jgi:hypothetical protein